MRPEDLALLAAVGRGNEWLRAALCTLARRGTALRLADPARAADLLAALRPWPVFKGGQFLFDLMEWEDFMVDGTPPPVLPDLLDTAAWSRLSERLRQVRQLIDSAADALREDLSWDDVRWDDVLGPAGVGVRDTAEDLPALQPGLYLYHDVVLGLVASAGPAIRARQRPRDRA